MSRIGGGAKKTLACSFCGRDESAVQKLIAGARGGLICDACVAACVDILDRDHGAARIVYAVKRIVARVRSWTRIHDRRGAYVEVLK